MTWHHPFCTRRAFPISILTVFEKDLRDAFALALWRWMIYSFSSLPRRHSRNHNPGKGFDSLPLACV